MDHLSTCVPEGKDPLNPGEEGLVDLRVIAAIDEAARSAQTIRVKG